MDKVWTLKVELEMSDNSAMIEIQKRDTNWDKRLDYKKGDLFWADEKKLVIVTKSGFRSPFTVKELIEIERSRND